MKKLFITALIISLTPMLIFSQTESNLDSIIIQGKKYLHQAVNRWAEKDLLSTRAYFERLTIVQPDFWLAHYYFGLADYRLVSYYFSQEKMDKAIKFIDEGIEHLLLVTELKNNCADAFSLLSSLYGNKIATNPMLGMSLGPKSGIAMGKAMQLEPRNPRNYLIAGLSAYFTPKMFGGGKDKAEENLRQALTCYDSCKVDNAVLPDWGHEEAYAWLGLLQMEQEQLAQAAESFANSLAINPQYNWVHYVLQPELDKKISGKKK